MSKATKSIPDSKIIQKSVRVYTALQTKIKDLAGGQETAMLKDIFESGIEKMERGIEVENPSADDFSIITIEDFIVSVDGRVIPKSQKSFSLTHGLFKEIESHLDRITEEDKKRRFPRLKTHVTFSQFALVSVMKAFGLTTVDLGGEEKKDWKSQLNL